MKLLPLFVYGTARVGQPLHEMIEDSVRHTFLVKAPGMELMVSKYGASFPYMVSRRPGVEPKVWGDLLLVERGRDLMRLTHMEVAAGYTLQGIRVQHDYDHIGEFALSFVWNRDTATLIPWGSPSWLSRNLTSTR